MAFVRPASAFSVRTFPKADSSATPLWQGPHYASVATLEQAKPWMQSECTPLRPSSSSRTELTSPYHLISTASASEPGRQLFTRRGRGSSEYQRPRCSSASLGRSTSTSILQLDYPLQSSPSLRTLRLDRRRETRPVGRPTPIFVPAVHTMPRTTAKQRPSWEDPMVAGIGYSTKFYYRD